MTYEFLKKNGTFLCKQDFNHNGIYAGTEYYYVYENNLYCREEPTNAFQYDGEIKTSLLVGDIEKALEEYNSIYWSEYLTDEEDYIKLCKMFNKNPKNI